MYKEILSLTVTIMGWVCKPETLFNIENVTTVFSPENLLPLAAINCGDTAEEILYKAKLKVSVVFKLRKKVQEYFIVGP